MKKFNKAVLLLLLFTLVSSICFAAPKKKDPLDAAIRETSDYLNSKIAKGSKIVILNIQSESGALSEYIIDELISNAVNDGILLVVDRQQLDAIRAEQNFQFSGEVDDKQALEIGKFFGAQSIISGAMGMIGKEYRLRIRALEVQTALVQGQLNTNIAKSTLITTLINTKSSTSIASSSGGKTTTTTTAARPAASPAPAATPAPAPAPAPAVPSYKIGDKGPAGGIIFYDKGNNAGGWRYLEAAPVEAEFKAVWSAKVWRETTIVENLQETIGSGKRNTQFIIEKFSKTTGEWDTAAQKCDELEFGGFDDWFLPSQDELDQMYGQLKRRNLGDFSNEIYFSSTQTSNTFRDDSSGSINFNNGSKSNAWKGDKKLVRPIRQVEGPAK